MKNVYYALVVMILAISLISCNKSETGVNSTTDNELLSENIKDGNILAIPSVSSISPTSAEIGDMVTITGTNFGSSKRSINFVTIKGIKATVYKSWSNTQIKVLVPSGSVIGSGKVSVTFNKSTSNLFDFTLLESSPVTIGSQVWLGRNLDVSTYLDGTAIPEVTDPTEWNNLTTGAWCYPNNDPALGAILGKLYNWYAVNDSRGLAPSGWHTPTDNEWKTLSMYLGMSQQQADLFGYDWYGTNEGGKMKEEGTSLWSTTNAGTTNSSGFTSLPIGYRSATAGYNFLGLYQWDGWWSSTEYSTTSAFMRGVGSGSNLKTYSNTLGKKMGFAVRCIQD